MHLGNGVYAGLVRRPAILVGQAPQAVSDLATGLIFLILAVTVVLGLLAMMILPRMGL